MKNKVLLFIAIGLGLISALLTYNYLSGIEAKQHVEMVDVVVANTKISANTEIRASMWHGKDSKGKPHPDAVQQLQISENLQDIVAGEQYWSRLLPRSSSGLQYPQRQAGRLLRSMIGVAGFINLAIELIMLATLPMNLPSLTTVLQNNGAGNFRYDQRY